MQYHQKNDIVSFRTLCLSLLKKLYKEVIENNLEISPLSHFFLYVLEKWLIYSNEAYHQGTMLQQNEINTIPRLHC